MASEEHWERRKQAIRRGAQQGGAAGMNQAARRFDVEHRTGRDLIGSEYGYHCEKCFKTLDYGEEVNEDGTILCKDCAKKDD